MLGEGSGMGGWEIGEGVGWAERGFKPNGTATEHREGGGPFGLESLYICEEKAARRWRLRAPLWKKRDGLVGQQCWLIPRIKLRGDAYLLVVPMWRVRRVKAAVQVGRCEQACLRLGLLLLKEWQRKAKGRAEIRRGMSRIAR
jgi:hypothetical protein